MKIIIIGGVAAGASAAAKARRVNEQAEIVVFERGPYVSFANCGLPYYIGDEIKNRANLFLQTPESFWKRFRVKVQVLHEVVSIDPQNKTVQVKNLSTQQEFSETYDKLILTPGAGAIVPPLPNINAQNVFVVKTVPDSDRVKQYIAENSPKRAVVIGGGFIGLESAEALVHRGIEVTLVELQPQLLPPFDKDMAKFVAAHLQENGIHLVLGNGISGFKEENDKATHVQLDNGEELAIDLAILSIGVRPELKLAKDIGLQIGASGGIVVDDFQQTSNPDVYAAGDAVEVRHLVTQKFTRIPLAGPANKQGRVAGANAAGGNMKFPGALGTSIVESMGIVAAKTGLSEKEATQQGLDYLVSFIHSQDHASYYPGSTMLHLKLISDRSNGRVLGAQVIGQHGVDKRIDVLATAISAKMTVEQLENLDLAYAPQFSSAKDPVILAGFVAANVQRGEVQTITCETLRQWQQQGKDIQLLDVRTSGEYEKEHLENAILVPVDELREKLTTLDRDKETVVYCRVGLRGYLATRILMQHGFKSVSNLTGGIISC